MICRTCGEEYAEGGDGWDGECPNCADISAQCPQCTTNLDPDCPLCEGTGIRLDPP